MYRSEVVDEEKIHIKIPEILIVKFFSFTLNGKELEMQRVFNTTGICIPEKHYMVNLDQRLYQIRKLVDSGKYFTINWARQYGKTTTLRALAELLRKECYVVLLDFQTFDNGNVFSVVFARSFLRAFRRNQVNVNEKMTLAIAELEKSAVYANERIDRNCQK